MASNAASPRNVFEFIKGCFWKKSIKTGQKMTTAQLQKIITETGYTPVQRDSLYRKIK